MKWQRRRSSRTLLFSGVLAWSRASVGLRSTAPFGSVEATLIDQFFEAWLLTCRLDWKECRSGCRIWSRCLRSTACLVNEEKILCFGRFKSLRVSSKTFRFGDQG